MADGPGSRLGHCLGSRDPEHISRWINAMAAGCRAAPRCEGVAKDGARCRGHRLHGSIFCYRHCRGAERDRIDAARLERQRRFAHSNCASEKARALKQIRNIERRRLNRLWLRNPDIEGSTLELSAPDELRAWEFLLGLQSRHRRRRRDHRATAFVSRSGSSEMGRLFRPVGQVRRRCCSPPDRAFAARRAALLGAKRRMSAVVIPRIRRLPGFEIGAIEARRREIAVYRASRKLAEASRRAAKCGDMPQEPERDDDDVNPGVRVNSRRIAEILAPVRREFEVLDPDEQERFIETIRLFAAERITLSEWRAVSLAVCERYQATLPAPEPPGRRVKAKDRPSNPPQGW